MDADNFRHDRSLEAKPQQGQKRKSRSNAKAPSHDDRHIGTRIRSRRMLIGLSQEKLGQALGVTFQQVQKYEKGVNRIAGGRLLAIARFLGVSIAYFYDGLDAGGSVEPNPDAELMGVLLGTAEGIRLARAFTSLEDAAVRRKAAELIETLAQVAHRRRN